jgi:hypothetical protein
MGIHDFEGHMAIHGELVSLVARSRSADADLLINAKSIIDCLINEMEPIGQIEKIRPVLTAYGDILGVSLIAFRTDFHSILVSDPTIASREKFLKNYKQSLFAGKEKTILKRAGTIFLELGLSDRVKYGQSITLYCSE